MPRLVKPQARGLPGSPVLVELAVLAVGTVVLQELAGLAEPAVLAARAGRGVDRTAACL